jgi:hypothetical protein
MAKFAVRSVKVVFAVDESGDDGKVIGVKEIPAQVFEAQFDMKIQSLVDQLLAQANGSSEVGDDGGDNEE